MRENPLELEIEDCVNTAAKVNINSEEFNNLIYLYSLAVKEIQKKIEIIQYDYRYLYDRDFIDHMKSRIKSPDSILAKMKKKNCDLTYGQLIEKINDIAGIRIVCPLKDDIFEMNKLIKEFPEVEVIKEKDYVTYPKESGYASYHIIALVPIFLNDNMIRVKVEIQIRTLAMDFWASLEHKIRYKSNGKVGKDLKKQLEDCAKAINTLDNKMINLYHN